MTHGKGNPIKPKNRKKLFRLRKGLPTGARARARAQRLRQVRRTRRGKARTVASSRVRRPRRRGGRQ